MKLKIAFVLVGCLVAGVMQGFAQSSDYKALKVVYDPLFWKDKLKLTRAQHDLIQQINTEFYVSLTALTEYADDPSYMKARSYELLKRRSQFIWVVFSPKQRTKWERLNQAPATGIAALPSSAEHIGRHNTGAHRKRF